MKRKKKVLILDGDQVLRRSYSEELTDEGYDVAFARSASEGIAKLERDNHDLVVMEINMPGASGLDALGSIAGKFPHLPLVINSASDDYRSHFGSWAADAYLVKSPDLSELKRTIRSLLSGTTFNGTPTPTFHVESNLVLSGTPREL